MASNGAAIALLAFGTLYLLKICGPIRYVTALYERAANLCCMVVSRSTMLLQNADRVFAGLLGVAMGRRLQHGKVCTETFLPCLNICLAAGNG